MPKYSTFRVENVPAPRILIATNYTVDLDWPTRSGLAAATAIVQTRRQGQNDTRNTSTRYDMHTRVPGGSAQEGNDGTKVPCSNLFLTSGTHETGQEKPGTSQLR